MQVLDFVWVLFGLPGSVFFTACQALLSGANITFEIMMLEYKHMLNLLILK